MEGPTPENPHVLLVNRHRDTNVLLERILRKWDLTLVSVTTGAEALAALRSQPFVLMMTRLGLDDMDGRNLMMQVKETFGIPGIALSGQVPHEEFIRRSLEAGFSYHLTMPLSLLQLRLAIMRALALQ